MSLPISIIRKTSWYSRFTVNFLNLCDKEACHGTFIFPNASSINIEDSVELLLKVMYLMALLSVKTLKFLVGEILDILLLLHCFRFTINKTDSNTGHICP